MKNRIVLKASAGTGKTFRLSLEYIYRILLGESYEEILVMTFTKKATSEIKTRIFEHMQLILQNEKEGKELLEILKKTYGKLSFDKSKFANTYFEMLKNKEKVKVYTIDSFTNMIFKKIVSPYLNIYSYEIISEDKNHEILEEVFQRLVSNDVYFQYFKMFFENYTEKDIENYIDSFRYIINARWKFSLANYKKREKFIDTNFILPAEEIIIKLKELIILKGKEEGDLLEFIKKDFRDYVRINDLKSKEKYIFDKYKKFLDKNFVNGTKTRGKKVEHIKTELDDLYAEFSNLLSKYVYNEKVIELENQLFNFVNILYEVYDKVKFSEKKFTHNDISNYTYQYLYMEDLNLIDEKGLVSYFFDLLDSKIETVFIDEFQDTSILQWKILKPIMENSKNMICVGDEKQSIYGWRGGEKKLFENLDDILQSNEEQMSTSYRSKDIIIEFVNRFFTGLNDKWQYFDVKAIKQGGYVYSKIQSNEAEEDELLECIVQRLKNDPIDYSKTGIIARKKKHLYKIADKLTEKNIPYIINDGETLLEHKAIKGLYFILRYIAYLDFFDLIRFLRSDLIDIEAKYLKVILQNKMEIEKYIQGSSIELDFEINLKNIFHVLRDIVKDYRNNLTYIEKENSFVEKMKNDLFLKTGVVEKFESPNDIKNIHKFISIAKQHNSLSDFLKYIEENSNEAIMRQEVVSDENSIKLMTIHKSKGLEFENQFLYWEISRKIPQNKGFKFYIKMDEKYSNVNDYLFSTAKYRDVISNCGFDFEEIEEQKIFLEEINNIYVALTRPKTNLYIYVYSKYNEEKTLSSEDVFLKGLFSSFPGYSEQDFFNGVSIGKLEKIVNTDIKPKRISYKLYGEDYFADTVYSSDDLAKSKALKIDEAKFNYSLELEFARKEGILIHYYMEFIKYNTDAEKKLARNMILHKYGNMFGKKRLADVFERIDTTVYKNLDLFDKRWKVFTEYEINSIIDEKEVLRRIDRINIDEKEKKVIIIDYKTGYTKEESQLEEYKKILSEILDEDYSIKTKFIEI